MPDEDDYWAGTAKDVTQANFYSKLNPLMDDLQRDGFCNCAQSELYGTLLEFLCNQILYGLRYNERNNNEHGFAEYIGELYKMMLETNETLHIVHESMSNG